tara:strand:- start:1672 stop:3171 length:1500 start_codon:yes stop_codon:yes gene_type:complete
LAERNDVDVRRLFTDQREKLPKKTDLFGISLSWELDGPVLLNLLEEQRIPIWSHNRKDNDPIVFGGGPVLTANPEPFAPFIDVVLLGDGEDLLPTFINNLHKFKQLSRLEKLYELSKVPGIYIPDLYTPKYSANGEFKGMEKNDASIPSFISKQTWEGKSLSHSKVITPDSVWPDIHMIEMVRSCPELCRFCLASYLTLPFRSTSIEESLIPAVEKGLQYTKRLGLLGASVTQHPQFEDFINWISQDKFNDIRLSVSSVRASTINAKITNLLKLRGSKSITIAIESGSERLRSVVNKKLAEEQIYAAAKYTLEGGLKNLKLYGMVGLPSEENEDIDATIKLLIALKKANTRLNLTFGVSTFVPKAHTPFQWQGVSTTAKKQLKKLSKSLRPYGINFRPESYGWSLIQALISRSDRRLAPVIAALRDSNNTLGDWKNMYQKHLNQNLSPEIYEQCRYIKPLEWEEIIHGNWNTNRALPWSHIEGPIKPKSLIQHHDLALN